ncbi:hypothetical protein BKK54_07265 [Rodentibacter genomosp. 1]|uniref:Uncharacterized protein n=1 Tax=Rodentibacter genomosp. 1 TaxID=1908264 RepID=A0A1V3J4J2_9PAST|nr:hypothetical protein [Rodentibacter genomosp. 1]OOF49985.1 hypothetical protein BKK54_07265 [Rodentibacter genomosp. 1]
MLNDIFNAYVVVNQNSPERLEEYKKFLTEKQQAISLGLQGSAKIMKELINLDEDLQKEVITGDLFYDLGELFLQNITLLQSLSASKEVANFYLHLPENQRTNLLNIGRIKNEEGM